MKNGIVCRILGGGLICVAALFLYGAQNLLLIPLGLRDTIVDISTLLVVASLMVAAGLGLVLLRMWGVYVFFITIVINWFVTLNLIDLNVALNNWQRGDMISLYLMLSFVFAPMVAGVIFFLSRQSLSW